MIACKMCAASAVNAPRTIPSDGPSVLEKRDRLLPKALIRMSSRVAWPGPGLRIRPNERSGALYPQNLERYRARWFDPDTAVGTVVDRYWHVRWRLGEGEVISQRIIDLPAVTLTIEEGDVPAPLVVTGIQQKAWARQIAGSGPVFAIRLRPAGLAIVSDLSPHQIANATVPLTSTVDGRLHAMLSAIAGEATAEARAHSANEAISQLMAERPIKPELLLANTILDELILRIRSRAGRELAEAFGVSERSMQRALKVTLGHGPKWISRRIRLQEIARLLSTEPDINLAMLAVDLGYADQAHLINDFRGVAGITPGAYRRSLLDLTKATN